MLEALNSLLLLSMFSEREKEKREEILIFRIDSPYVR